jgi:hypothetical protein
MKLHKIFASILLIIASSSCAMMTNEKTDKISINSSPQGAQIIIDGKYHGVTPATLNIEAKNYLVTLNKEGYGSTELQLESWVSSKTGACMADAMMSILIVPMYSFYYSGYCTTFKEKEYYVTIPNNAPKAAPSKNRGYNSRSRNNYYNN